MTGATPAGDFDYETHGAGYTAQRRTDPRIAAHVHAALGMARTVMNVGAGAGSYEPPDRYVVAVEPSPRMRAQRPPARVPAVIATAESLPFDDDAFDAAMAMITVHQWPDPAGGLAELRRVTRGPVVVLAFDNDGFDRFWLAEYIPELMAAARRRDPPLETIAAALGAGSEIRPVPIPNDCVDGFVEACYARPEAFLDAAVRGSQSSWGFVTAEQEERAVERLRSDLASGAWDERHGALRTQPEYVGGLSLVVGPGAARAG